MRQIVSNCIQPPRNCGVAHKPFHVCCADPCQDFCSDLEVAIGAPESVPEDVLAIVSTFTYGLGDVGSGIAPSRRHTCASLESGTIPQAFMGHI